MGEKGNAELLTSAASSGGGGLVGDVTGTAAGIAKDVAVAAGTAVVSGKVEEQRRDDEDEGDGDGDANA
jgi:hypothetical protein